MILNIFVDLLTGLLIPLFLLIISIVIFLILFFTHKKYKKFVINHSVALKNLCEINNNYTFKAISNFDMYHDYDNENFYDDISCKDYLTYQLVYIKKEVNIALKNTLDNKIKYEKYQAEISQKCRLNQYDVSKLLRNKKYLVKLENKIFNKQIKKPTTYFSIVVRLYLTNINGRYKCEKEDIFTAGEVKEIITKLNQKRGTFYLNNDIWKSICKVERGKVSNRMRFAVYERDHYRCRKCGRRTDDLEIDHIVPISKGGKSTFDNLQTLCHKCNYEKGSKIERL